MMFPAPLLKCPWIPHSLPLVNVPRAVSPTQRGPGLSPSQTICWLAPTENPIKAQPSKLPPQVDLGRFPGLAPTTPTGGRRLEPEEGPSGTLWRKATAIARFNILHNGRWWPSGCQPPSRRPPGGGMPRPSLVGLIPKILCLFPMPLAPRISRSQGKRKPWPWLGCYRPVSKNLGPQQAFYVMLHESFRDVWPPDDP